MSWLSDHFNDAAKFYGEGWKQVTSLGGNFENDVSKFFENELVNKSDLRGAQLEAALGGVPYVGDFIRGIEGANQLEDLYNSTGKVPKYPGSQNAGTSSLGSAIEKLSNKIEDGAHDLYQYYSGEKDKVNTANAQEMFKQMGNPINWNLHRGSF